MLIPSLKIRVIVCAVCGITGVVLFSLGAASAIAFVNLDWGPYSSFMILEIVIGLVLAIFGLFGLKANLEYGRD